MADINKTSNGHEVSKAKTLRPHQQETLKQVFASLKLNNRVVCQAPTGFGKTVLASKIIGALVEVGGRVIVTVPLISLIDQTVEALEAEGITSIGVMQGDHPRKDQEAKVQVASVQTLLRREIPRFDLAIVDECHINSQAIENMIRQNPSRKFIGFSATPWRKGLGLIWQDLVAHSTIDSLIKDGYLSPFTAFAPDNPDLSSVKISGGDYQIEQAAKVMRSTKLTGNVVSNWLERGNNRPTLVFAVNKDHAFQLHHEFTNAGVSSAFCIGETSPAERELIEKEFRSGKIQVVCSVRTLTTGIDWPVSCIIDAAPTKSEMLHVQKIGRGLRINPGTEDLVIFDHAGNLLRLGLPNDIFYSKLDKTREGPQQRKPRASKKPSECIKCDVLFAGIICPNCGHQRELLPNVETLDGKLIQLKPRKMPTKADKQNFFSELNWIRRDRNYKPGWTNNKYKEKFGVWPRGLDDTYKPPSEETSRFVQRSMDAYFEHRRQLR